MNHSKSIKLWAKDDMPREKLIKHGERALSNSELIAILLGSGTIQTSAVGLAQELLQTCQNNLTSLSKKNVHELCEFKGIGPAKAVKLVAAFELSKRREQFIHLLPTKIQNSNDAHANLIPYLANLSHEEFWCIYLNQANHILSIENISKGGITGTLVDIRILFNKALSLKATGIVLAHNHPSGNTDPSKQDILLTKKVEKAAKLLEISLHDHLIIADKQYLSMADEGMI